ncbi:MAG: DNA mismatch repair protein MutS, partial [Ruminiclostridium sp.]|nr:DNA mismatch repair protein MutS [Ruminiclostridium sp.]
MAVKADTDKKPTPMLEQYLKVREQYKECVLFYRLGDFYEMFYDDAENISKELELTLTSRAGVPMCGVPYHSVEQYIKRLIDNGHKVAICEQMEDPALAKGLVDRDVIRVVTPGTLYEDSMLDESRNNYIGCFFIEKDVCGMVFADISTGEFHAYEKRGKTMQRDMIAEISRYVPSEILFNDLFIDQHEVNSFVQSRLEGAAGSLLDDIEFSLNDGDALIEQYFDVPEEAGRLEKIPLAKKALFAVFRYINETQKAKIRRSVRLTVHFTDDYMDLGITARRNLELTETMRNGDRKGSLMWVIDKTKTAMGRRKLRRFIEQPLLSVTAVLERLDAVERFFSDYLMLEETRDCLSGIYDLERLITRVVYRAAGPRDVVALGNTCKNIPLLKEKLAGAENVKLLKRLDELINPLTEIATLVENAIVDNPPALTKDGGYIRDGFNEELDRLRSISKGGKDVLAGIEQREREATGIKNLRVGYNRVFGYYIEVSKGNIPLVPDTYIRKQTLTNGERYITEELKKTENEILGANDKILAIEAEIFSEVRDFISSKLEIVQRTADAIAYVDVLQSYAAASRECNFV